MSRAIDADALETHEQLEPMGNGRYEYVKIVYKNDIDAAPTIEARKKGRWEKQRETYCSWSCSACKEVVVTMPERMGYPLYDYCPNCGSDMREEGGADG